MTLLVSASSQLSLVAPGVLALASSGPFQGTLSAAFQNFRRSCASNSLNGNKDFNKAQVRSVHRCGNVYPTLTQQQLDQMRTRRLTSNCSTEQLESRHRDAHQHKHIMLCSGLSCRASCKSCGLAGAENGQRCWDYLSRRLKEINQLRSETDEQEPILTSRMDCLQVQNLLPALAATLACHGPVAVVYPEGVWYDRLTPLVLERIIEEHLLGGHTVTSHVMMGSRAPNHDCNVLPALDISRRATPTGSFACHYAW